MYKLPIFILLFLVTIAKQTVSAQVLSLDKSGFIAVDSNIAEDSLLSFIIKPYSDTLNADMNRVIGFTPNTIIAAKPEGPLSNLIADVIVFAANNKKWHGKKLPKVQMGIINIKGIRSSWVKGDILVKNVFEILPFENQLVVLGLNGAQLIELFNFMASENGDGLSGASFVLINGKAENIKVNGKPVKRQKLYTIAVPDYIANGGDKYAILQNCLWRIDSGLKIRDVMLKYIEMETRNGKMIVPNTNRRIEYGE